MTSISALKAMPPHERALHLAGEIAVWRGWMKPSGSFFTLTPEGKEKVEQMKQAEPEWLIDIKLMAYSDLPLQNLAILLSECQRMLNRWRDGKWKIPADLTLDDWPYDRALGHTSGLLYYLPKRYVVRHVISQAESITDAQDLVNALKQQLFEADHNSYALDFTGVQEFDVPFFIHLQNLIATTLPQEIKWRVIGLNEQGQRVLNLVKKGKGA